MALSAVELEYWADSVIVMLAGRMMRQRHRQADIQIAETDSKRAARKTERYKGRQVANTLTT